MAGVDNLFFEFAFLLKFHDSFHLRSDIVTRLEVNFRFLHQLEKTDLYATSTDIPPENVGWSCQLVGFVKINDAILSKFEVIIRLSYKVTN